MGTMIAVCTVFSEQVVGLFNTDPDVIKWGSLLMRVELIGYMIYIPSEVFLGCSRGMKHAGVPTILNFIGICATRIVWVLFIFPLNREVWMLYLCYPVSWTISTILQGSYYLHIRRKINKASQ